MDSEPRRPLDDALDHGAETVATAPPSRVAQILPLLYIIAVVAVLWLAPAEAGKSATLLKVGVLVGFAILSWTFGLLPEPLTTLIFFFLTIVFHAARPAVVFSGFSSSAWWLVFGGSIIAVAVQTTGLGRRLAGLIFGRATGSYGRAVTAVALASVGLAFVMPSTTGRVLLLTPIVIAFAEGLGLAPGRIGYTGLILTVGAASFIPPTAILPANVPNSILMGAADQLYGVKLSYGPYFLLHFPILGVLKTALLIWLVCRLFPERGPLAVAVEQPLGPMSREERRLAIYLLLSLILFATDFLHGISAAWVALGIGIFCLLPGIGVVSVEVFCRRVSVVTLFYIAGILGLAAVVVDSGLSEVVSRHLLALAALSPGNTATNVATLSAIGAGLGLLTTLTAVPAVLTPLAREFATASGLPLLSVLMLQVVVFSTVLLPFEVPPLMIALQLGGVGIRAATKLCLALAAITIVVLLPLDYFWWRLLGYLP